MKINKTIPISALVIGALLFSCGYQKNTVFSESAGKENQTLRDESIEFSHEVADSILTGGTINVREELKIKGLWKVSIDIYFEGIKMTEGSGRAFLYSRALEKAVRDAFTPSLGIDSPEVSQSRFLIRAQKMFDKPFSFVEYNGVGKELAKDLTAVRHLDKALILEKIEAGKNYLLRSMNKNRHAFYKKYFVLENTYGNRLRTIYTASSLYTLLKVSDISEDERIKEVLPKIAEFLFFMQSQEGLAKGAFHYSFNTDTQEKDGMFVVGTASKTIFTLLELYSRTKDEKYLASAKKAGEWLLKMQNIDGSIINYMEEKDGKIFYGRKFSCLYTGQVLSAFSRLYIFTEDKRYYNAAEKIAKRIIGKAVRDSYFLRDDYRISSDPVPTSWTAMSLLDFYKAGRSGDVKAVMIACADKLLERQYKDPPDIMNYGRIEGTIASGTGWIAEVLTELYSFGKTNGWEKCEKYRDAAILAIRWLAQNTYSDENTYFIMNPERVFGGIIRNYDEETIRTDAVCHGLNAYIGITKYMDEGEVLDVSEKEIYGTK